MFLATRRPEGKRLGGLWEFPGGKVEEGESADDALRREVREELCLVLEDLKAMVPVVHEYSFGKIELRPYLARCRVRPEICLTEHTASRWVRWAEVGELEWAPADIPVLEELRTLFPGQAE